MPTPATVEASESNGAGEVVTDGISNINFGGADIPNLVAANHPIVRSVGVAGPGTGNCWSFSKALRFHVVSMGDSLLIDSLRFWKASGALVTGERIWRKNGAAQAFEQPTKSTNISVDDILTSDPGGANVGIGGSYAGSIAAAPAYSNYFLIQTALNSAALTPIGAVNQKAIVLQWNES